jgi:hypothetical protein
MPVSVKCTNVQIAADGSRVVSFDDGSATEFPSLSDVQEFVDSVDSGSEGVALAKKILLARYIRTDADGSDTAAIVNKTCTINPGAPNPVQIG